MKKQKKPASLSLRGGSYSLILTAVVLALVIVLNILAGALPENLTKYDMSATKLYSVTGNTRAVISALEDDVTIYWIVQAGEEDDVIENLLGRYEGLSDHIHVVKKNPDVYPAFAEQYTDETVENNSLVVEAGEKSRFIGYRDIYVQEPDLYSYTYNTSFDGEGAITSAIDYVISEDLPEIRFLEGHGETELPASFKEQMEKENMEVSALSLLTAETVPEDTDCVIIFGPQSDISPEEKKLLSEYVENGGKLFVAAGPVKDGRLENLNQLLEDYGVTVEDGIVVEGDREHYALQTPYALIPEMGEHEITASLAEARYFPILPISSGLVVSGEAKESGRVTELLTTSDLAFSKKAGYGLETYEKEEGDTDGPFAPAVAVECENDGRIVWFASSEFLMDMYNALSSGANSDLAMNALACLNGEREAMAIRSKSLNYNYLTISESTSSMLQVMMIGVFPLLYLGIGAAVVLRRRRKQNEAV
ncbi:MAG: GldG family protein [Sakamotonia sp.]|jgi:ABC-2 type transport system permease protein